MGSDLFALSALARELNDNLQGARIDKIQQPEIDELRFSYARKAKSVPCGVLQRRRAENPPHDEQKVSPQVAPNLCMLLRKYLLSATISDVSIYNYDRIVRIRFDAKPRCATRRLFIFS